MFARSRRRTSILLTLLAVLALTAGAAISAQPVPSQADVQATTSASDAGFRSSPVMFIENAGQWPEAARFQVWGGPAGTMWLAESAIWITVVERAPSQVAGSPVDRLQRFRPEPADLEPETSQLKAVNIKLSFVDANPHPRIEPFDRLDTVVSYFIGNEPDKWRPDVPVWGGVRYAGLYPNVDIKVTSEGGQMVLRLVAQPGADVNSVHLRVEGSNSVAVEGDALRLDTAAGEFTLPLLRVEASQAASPIIQSRSTQVFDVAVPFAPSNLPQQWAIANSKSVADNTADLLYGTFLGGGSSDEGNAIAADKGGSAYLTGRTWSGNFPTTPGAFDRSLLNDDAYVVKLDPTGCELAYATFLGGSGIGGDVGSAIVVDDVSSAFVMGGTDSPDFPTTSGAFDTSFNGGYGFDDAFVVKLNSVGSELLYSTYLGGNGEDVGNAIALDGAGSAFVTGGTWSSDFPTTSGAFDRGIQDWDAFVVKLNAAGSGLVYATFLGGYSTDNGYGIAVDGMGCAYVTGSTWSSDFPTTPGAFDRSFNNGDAFVAKLNVSGTGLAYAFYLGGSGYDAGNAIAIDRGGSAFVMGTTESSDFPTTPGAFDRSYGGGGYLDDFVVKVDLVGGGLLYSTYLGGGHIDRGSAIAVDGAGNVYIRGTTYSSDFPTTSAAFDRSLSGSNDAFVVKLDPAGSKLVYSTFLGGSGSEWLDSGVALDRVGSAYVIGTTWSPDFPTTSRAFDRSHNGASDAFVVKLAMGGSVVPPTPTPVPTYTISGRVTDASGHGIPSVTVSAGSSLSTTTDANGNYTFTGLTTGTYNLSPSRYLYAFSPPSRTVTVPPNATGQNFVQTPVVDLSVNRIEVAQVFVDTTTTPPSPVVPLIAKKDSLVRVFVNVTGVPALGAVTARLHLRDAKGVEHVLQETYPPSAIWARQNPDVRLLQDTVNFRPNPEWLSGVVALWADVDPYDWIPETDETNNTNPTPVTATFVPGKKWRIAWTSVGYLKGHEIYWPDQSIVEGADQRLRTIYPVGKDDVEYFYQPGMSEILDVSFAGHDQEYVNAANRFYKRVAAGGAWVDGKSADRLFAWAWDALPQGEANPVCGHSDPTWWPGGLGRVAAGIDKCDKPIDGSVSPIPAANTLAHEIGHTLWMDGLHHPEHDTDNRYCFGYVGEIGYHPIYDGLPKASIGAYGLDIARRWVLSPNTNYDFMAYCWPTWVSPFHYTHLHDDFVEHGSAAGNQANTATTKQLLLSGLVYTPTMQTALDPFYVLRSAAMPDPDTGTNYCVELRSAGQDLLDKRCFDLAFRNIETDEPADVDGFVLMTPYPVGTAQIVLTHLGTPIATRAVSLHEPTVRLLSPNGGETWVGTGTQTITWTASDQDGDLLHFALSYSTDGGASWIPAGLDLTGTQHALDVSMLPGGTSVLLRISATDGVNTTDDVSDGPFTVGRKAPMAFILSPEEGAHFFPGQAIWLEGRAFDLEDGTLNDAALRWSSDRDGVLGTGKLLITILSPGEHVVTLTATDSDGARATATIRLSAGDRVFLPLVLRAR